MKKVLFISLAKYTTLGGTQDYTYKLMQIFQEMKWEIWEYNCFLGIDKIVKNDLKDVITISNVALKPSKNKFMEGIRFNNQVKRSNNDIAQLLKKEKFDLIIDNRQHPFTWKKKWGNDISKLDNCIWIQHFHLGMYDGKSLTNPFFAFFLKLYINFLSKNRNNVLYSHKNIVLYDNENTKSLNYKRFKINPTINEIMLSDYNKVDIVKNKDIKGKERDIDFLYIGRINNVQKNINFTNKVFKNFNYKITIIGDGKKSFLEKIKKNPNINYCGYLNHEEIKTYLKRTKFLFFPSKYEGFSYVIVQALSYGVIPILLDTFESAKIWKNVGCVFDKNISVKKMKEQLLKIYENYNDQMIRNAIEFAYNNLSKEIFIEKWKKIIEKF